MVINDKTPTTKQPVVPHAAETTATYNTGENNEFSQTELEEAFASCITELQKDSPALVALQKPTRIGNGFELEIPVTRTQAIQLKGTEQLRMITEKLRNLLGNQQITIKLKEIETEKTQSQSYLPADILDEAIKQNPAIATFKEKLGLTLEY